MEFRSEVLEAKRRRRARVVASRPRSRAAESASLLLGGLFICALLGLGFIPTRETVDGRATVHYSNARAVQAPVEGMIAEVYVQPGVRVESGQALMQLSDPAAQIELKGARRALDQALVSVLRDRSRREDGSEVRPLVDAVVGAQTRNALYRVEAPIAGDVAGSRVQLGERVVAGDRLVTLLGPGARELLATVDVPAHAAERVRLGARVVVSFGEAGRTKRHFEIVSRSAEATPRERGEESGAEPEVRFWARYAEERAGLPAPKLGMTGRAEVIYRDRNLFEAVADIVVGTED